MLQTSSTINLAWAHRASQPGWQGMGVREGKAGDGGATQDG